MDGCRDIALTLSLGGNPIAIIKYHIITSRSVGGYSTPRPGHFTPGKEILVLFYRRLSGPRSNPGQVWEICSSPTLNVHTFQFREGCYTGYAIPAAQNIITVSRYAYLNKQVIMNHGNVEVLQFVKFMLKTFNIPT